MTSQDNMSSTTIETVLGSISSEKLGFCHSHEHLFIAPGTSGKINPNLIIDDQEKTQKELSRFKRLGGQSVVDAQPLGCGRMAKNLVEASKTTSVNIIASTGFHKLIFYPTDYWVNKIDEDQLTKLFIFEIEEGMSIDADMGIPKKFIPHKAGIIKTASGHAGITHEYRKLFRAAARAAKITKTPILSHTEMGKYALDQIKLFDDEGLNPDQIILCHLDRDLKDLAYHREVAQTGVYLELDTIGRFKYHSDEKEARYIVKMIEWGFEDKILLGLDTTRARLKSYGGSIGLGYIKERFIPLLLQYGVTRKIIDKFTTINPAKALAKRSDVICQ